MMYNSTITIDGNGSQSNLMFNAGYDNVKAILELVHNSIDAHATEIRIDIEDGVNGTSEFSISDNGDGMSHEELVEQFFTEGASKSKSCKEKVGCFGFGKLANGYLVGKNHKSIVEVVTKSRKEGTNPYKASWLIDNVNNDTTRYNIAEIEYDTNAYNFGTKISLNSSQSLKKDIKKIVGELSCALFNQIQRNHLSVFVNGKKLMPQDYMYRCNKYVIERKLFHNYEEVRNIYKNRGFKYFFEKIVPDGLNGFKTIQIPFEINITTFYSDIDESNIWDYDNGKGNHRSVMTTKRSGIYFVTNGITFSTGGNFDKCLGKTSHTDLDGLRIEVIVDKDAWDLLGITWNKGSEFFSLKSNCGCENLCKVIEAIVSDFVEEKNNRASKVTLKEPDKLVEESIKKIISFDTIFIDLENESSFAMVNEPKKVVFINRNSQMYKDAYANNKANPRISSIISDSAIMVYKCYKSVKEINEDVANAAFAYEGN